MAKTIDIDQLVRLAKSGAKISTEERPQIHANIEAPPPVDIQPLVELLQERMTLDALVEKLGEMHDAALAATKKRDDADKSRAQTQLEVIYTLQALIKQLGVTKSQPIELRQQAIDLSPLAAVLKTISEAVSRQPETPVREPQSYRFVIERDKRGFAEAVLCEPYTKPRYGT